MLISLLTIDVEAAGIRIEIKSCITFKILKDGCKKKIKEKSL